MVKSGFMEGDMITDLIRNNRSCRRFYQDHSLELATLRELVDLARLSASAANLQPLKYVLSCNDKKNDQIFSCLKWAGYIKDWSGPPEGERPSGYIIILVNEKESSEWIGYDSGIAGQSILLGATAKGLAGCMIGAINRKKLKDQLHIPNLFKILLVIAIGKPKEKVVIEEVGQDNNIRYWRDGNDVHHVPKRKLDDIIISAYDSSFAR